MKYLYVFLSSGEHRLICHNKIVRDIEFNSTAAALASAIISMGNSLNLKVIAEGGETEGSFTMLKERHCDEMQSCLFSRPVSVDAVAGLLRSGLAKRAGEKDDGIPIAQNAISRSCIKKIRRQLALRIFFMHF